QDNALSSPPNLLDQLSELFQPMLHSKTMLHVRLPRIDRPALRDASAGVQLHNPQSCSIVNPFEPSWPAQQLGGTIVCRFNVGDDVAREALRRPVALHEVLA